MKKGYFDETELDWIIPVTDRHGNNLNLRKGRIHGARDKYDYKRKKEFTVRRLIWTQQSDHPEKIILLEELAWSDERTELRLSYYTTNKYGRWSWGQYALMIPKSDFDELLAYAREKQIL